MGNLTENINKDIKAAMLAKESAKLEALRAVKSGLLLLKSNKGGSDISEEQEIQLLRKLVKQREESAIVYQENNREQLSKDELFQAEVIKKYLPEPIDEAKLNRIIQDVIDETGASSGKDIGVVMNKVKEITKGRADNKIIANKIKSILSI